MTTASTTAPTTVRATGLWKQYGGRNVVRDVSLAVEPGKVLGLVGPNGSGKTTTIRMLLNIVPPERGSVEVFGAAINAAAQQRIGYLPEERGLYRGLRVVPTLVYLAELKGLARTEAEARAEQLLERLGLTPHRRKKIQELSRGLGQLVQFAATIMHRPAFLVLDEPFSGLDPVNVRLMKDVIAELRDEGVGTMFSTHQMTDVEELCDNVVMIHEGEVVLDGPLSDIKRRFAGDWIHLTTHPAPEGLAHLGEMRRDGSGYAVRLAPGSTPELLLRELVETGARVDRFEVATPSLEEIFLQVVKAQRE